MKLRNRLGIAIEGNDSSEIFFEYNKKHKWSITKTSDGMNLHYYPGEIKLEQLASMDEKQWVITTQ